MGITTSPDYPMMGLQLKNKCDLDPGSVTSNHAHHDDNLDELKGKVFQNPVVILLLNYHKKMVYKM